MMLVTWLMRSGRYIYSMQEATSNMPNDLAECHALITQQRAQLSEFSVELEKLRKLLSHFVNDSRSEKRIVSSSAQELLPFESEEEYQAAKAEADAEAEQVIEKYAVERHVRKKKPRTESLPSHLPRVEVPVPVDESLKLCSEHGERQLLSEDVIETLVIERPKLYVEVRRYPKYVCVSEPQCGVTSPERPTGLVEGDRYSASIAATVIDAKWSLYLPIYRQQDILASSGWTPSRSTLLNLVAAAEFVIDPFMAYMRKAVQQDIGVGLDETSCRMLLPREDPVAIPGDAKSRRLAEKMAEVRAEQKRNKHAKNSLLAKMWVYSGLHQAPYNIFDFRVSRHRDGPDEFFRDSQCKVQGDCFSGNRSVVMSSDGRLEFVACWTHARRKVVESSTYQELSDKLLAMIQALYDIEERGKSLTWQARQELRQRESKIVLATIEKWLASPVVDDVLPKADFAEAIRYLRNHWKALNVYVSDGRIPIDNNSVEQLMKQVALGRKAWLFVCNVEAGERSAKMMSLVSSARRHDLDVFAYIQDVLTKLLAGCTDYRTLLPDIWKQSHPEAIRVYRQEERRDKADRKQLRAARRRLLKRDLAR